MEELYNQTSIFTIILGKKNAHIIAIILLNLL